MPKKSSQKSAQTTVQKRHLDARPDTLDFRDLLYNPTLVEVPTHRDLDEYRKVKIPILDQGHEGACTGFGLATIVHYLLRIRRDAKLRSTSAREIADATLDRHFASAYGIFAGEPMSNGIRPDRSNARRRLPGAHCAVR